MSRSTGGLAAVLTVLLLLTGCLAVPTSGTVERVPGQQPACQNCVNVEVAPPVPGDGPQQVVEGFLRANANYQPNYSVARQFLTAAAAESWSPDSGVTIYTGSPAPDGGNRVLLDGRRVGSLARDRTYTAQDGRLRHSFDLVQEGGQWRIAEPPPGLFVAEFAFTSFYEPYTLYFLGPDGVLVPDLIYLPGPRSPANVASTLTKALLAGPTTWLKDAVSTAFPPDTTLDVDSVTIVDGVADVPLSDSVLGLPNPERDRLAAQLVATLDQVTGVQAVRLTVNSQPFAVTQSDPDSLVIPVDSVPAAQQPVPEISSDTSYGVRDGAVLTITPTVDRPLERRLPGALGAGDYRVDTLAASPTGRELALVTDGGRRLRSATQVTDDDRTEVRTVLDGATGLLRPQISRSGELWTVGRRDGRQQIWTVTDGQARPVDSTALGGAEILAFRVSPDGSRVAMARRTDDGAELGLARIVRGDRVVVSGWRRLNISDSATAPVRELVDVGWLDATTVMVLGAASEDATPVPIRVSQDAAELNPETEASDMDAVQLSVLLRDQSVVIVGRNGQTFRYDGDRWSPFVDTLSSFAAPG